MDLEGSTATTEIDILAVSLSANRSIKELPFAPLVPNAETIAAMREARGGNLPKFDDVQSLLDDLHAGD